MRIELNAGQAVRLTGLDSAYAYARDALGRASAELSREMSEVLDANGISDRDGKWVLEVDGDEVRLVSQETEADE